MTDNFLNLQQYKNMTDDKVVELVQSGDENALNFIMGKYKPTVNMKASKFFAIGVEKDDIIQEGLIGLYKATQSYSGDKQNSFKSFANMCIERQLITVVKSANRQKNIPLNSAFSLNAPIYEDGETDAIEVLDTNFVEDPLDTIANKEYMSQMESKIDENLSDFERKVLIQYKQGKSYNDIAKEVNSKVKSVDTAIQRIRKKANKIKNQIDGKEEI
jgi:RNA polymerase sporulation-specific sigma factor